jgi:hypothetical protein
MVWRLEPGEGSDFGNCGKPFNTEDTEEHGVRQREQRGRLRISHRVQGKVKIKV